MKISDWHDRLHNHFSGLLQQRKNTEYSIFAIEHGLESAERIKLKQSIHEHIARLSPDGKYWLPWVVYAAEIGYEFDGREYWQSFEDKTPGWRLRGMRAFIRDGYKNFVNSFGGFRPSGVWANHFNIICYPITHAILPRDLQYQLSQVLYDLRTYINRTLIQTPRLLGKQISEHSYQETKRFQQFAQNHELIGLIAREILTIDELGSDNAILLPTFRRIISDLRKENNAGELVDEARSTIKSRTGGRGRTDKTLKPQLFLRRTEIRNWDVFIELPDLAPLASLSEAAEKFLPSARPRITGSVDEKRLAPGLIVNQGNIRKQLGQLPQNDEPLLTFRRELSPELEKFFRKDFVLKLPDITIFSVQVDGLAQLHDSNVIRQEENYIVMSRGVVKGKTFAEPLATSCENVYLYALSAENLQNGEVRDLLRELNLKIETEFQIIPTGLLPTKWDGESKVEYLDGEIPSFALQLKLPWHLLRVQLEDFDELEIENSSNSEYTYFALPKLATGLYKLTYSVKEKDEKDFRKLGELSIGVRDRTIWQPGTTSQNALMLLSDPPKPTFEQLFAGKTKFEIYSPETSVKVSIAMFGKDSETKPLVEKHVVTAVLPLGIEELNRAVCKAVEDPQLIEQFDSARLARLNFESADLGGIGLNFRREFNPIQWEAKSDRNGVTILNLSEDSFGDDQTSVYKYEFEKPDVPIPINYDIHFPDYRVNSEGGLFVASTSKQRKAISVLRANQTASYKSFASIGENDDLVLSFRNYARTPEEFVRLLDLHCLWHSSRTVGSVFNKRDLQKVSDGFIFEMVCLIDDGNWKKLENAYVKNRHASREKEALIKSISHKASIQTEICRLTSNMLSTEELVFALTDIYKMEITEEEIKKSVANNKIRSIVRKVRRDWFAEFALRLCSHPETLKEWSQTEERFRIGLNKMFASPSLVRAARFIALHVGTDSLGNTQFRYKWDWL